MKWENYVAEVTLRKKGSLFLDFKGNKIFNLKKFMGTNNLVLQNRVHDCYHETSRLYTPYMNFHCDALYIIPSLNNFCKWQIEENCSLIFGFSTFSKMYKKTSIYFSVSRTTRGGEGEDLPYLKIIIFMNLWGLPSFLEKPAQPLWYFVLDFGWVLLPFKILICYS